MSRDSKSVKVEVKSEPEMEQSEGVPNDVVENRGSNGETDEDGVSGDGLYDRPLVVEGKRVRHQVHRLSDVKSPSVQRKKLPATSGMGTMLGDIEYVHAQLSKHNTSDLRSLHRVLFSSDGTNISRKKNIRHFNGFPFQENSADYKKKLASLMKLTIDQLKLMKNILGLQMHGTTSKEPLVLTILAYLMIPKDLNRKLPTKKRKRASESARKTPTKRVKKNKKDEEDDSPDVSKDDDGGSVDNGSGSNESDDDEKQEQKKPIKEKTGISEKGEEQPKDSIFIPSDEEVEKKVRELLSTFDLSQVSMKQMCQAVAEKFPNSNLNERKMYLKEKIRNALESDPR